MLPFVLQRILFDGQSSINVRPREEKDGPSDLEEISLDPMILAPKQTNKWPSFLEEPIVCQVVKGEAQNISRIMLAQILPVQFG